MIATPYKSEIHTYIEQIRTHALLTIQQERELSWRFINENNLAARNALITANLKLVVSISRKHQHRGVPMQELIAEGNVGLIRAAEGFDPARGVRFSTYATKVIEQAIRAGIFAANQTCHIPAYMADMIARSQSAAKRLHASLDRLPTAQELANDLGISIKSVVSIHHAQRARYASVRPSLERHGHRVDTSELIEDDRSVSPEEAGTQCEVARKLLQLLDRMDSRHARVIKMRVGMDGREGMTLNQVGRELGVSKERVRQIEKQARHRLNTMLELSDNHEYLNHRAG